MIDIGFAIIIVLIFLIIKLAIDNFYNYDSLSNAENFTLSSPTSGVVSKDPADSEKRDPERKYEHHPEAASNPRYEGDEAEAAETTHSGARELRAPREQEEDPSEHSRAHQPTRRRGGVGQA